MRRLLLLLHILFISNYFYGQCPAGDIILNTQAGVDNFSANYPGCNNIQGNLIINGLYITNLNGLSNINEVNGDLTIERALIDNLSGLDNLISIGGDFTLSSGTIDHVNALINLTTINGSFILNNNDLANLTGLDNLTTIGENLVINSGPSQDLTGLGGLTNILGDLTLRGGKSLVGLENLQTVEGNVGIMGNYYMLNLQGIENLVSVGGNFEVSNNTNFNEIGVAMSLQNVGGDFTVLAGSGFTSLTGFENLLSIGGTLKVSARNMPSYVGLNNLNFVGENLVVNQTFIKNFNGLDALNEIGGNLLADNSLITDINIPALTTIYGDLHVTKNNDLTSIALSGLTTVSQNLTITENYALTSIVDISSLQSTGGMFQISKNLNLTSLASMNSLESVGGDFLLNDNDNLANIDGFNALKEVSGTFSISESYDLESISGFSLLETTGAFAIQNDNSLQSIPSFNSLTDVSGDLSLNQDYNLVDINGFSSLLFVDGELSIEQNSKLTGISGFDLLDTTKGIRIASNLVLTSINGFDGMNTVEGDLHIGNNAALGSVPHFDDIITLTGKLYFTGNRETTEFLGFEMLNSVGGIHIEGNTLLNTLPSFSNLTQIEVDLFLKNNPSITNLDVFSPLLTIGGNFTIDKNSILYNIEGLNNVQTVGGSVFIRDSNINTGFDSLLSIGDTLSFYKSGGADGNSEFSGFDSLTSVGGLFSLFQTTYDVFNWPPNLSVIGGSLGVVGNQLTAISNIDALSSVGGNVGLSNNHWLQRIQMDNVLQIGGHLEVANTRVEVLSMNSLASVGGYVDIKSILHSINLVDLVSVGDYLSIMLPSLEPYCQITMDAIANIGTDFTLNGGFKFTKDLENITTINGDLYFFPRKALSSVSLLQNIQSVSGNATFRGHISSFTGLESLSDIGGNLTIQSSYSNGQTEPIIENLNGFQGLQSIDGDLEIIYNPSLASLEGLENLQWVEGKLILKQNNVLANIDALANIDENKLNRVEVYFNPMLSTCSVSSVCSFLTNDGDHIIHSNLTNCNAKEEILANCDNSFITVLLEQTRPISCNGELAGVEASVVGGTEPYTYELYDATTGTPLYNSTSNMFDDLPAGNYYLLVTDSNLAQGQSNTVVISGPESMNLSLSTTEITCNGNNDGQLEILVSGGLAPYQYSLDGVNYVTSNIFTNLTPGSYSAYVRDANNCNVSSTIEFLEPEALSVTATVITNPCPTSNEGAIELMVTGGNPPYEYSLDGVQYVSSNVFESLGAGLYDMYMRDSFGCSVVTSVVLEEVANCALPNVKFNSDVTVDEGSGLATFEVVLDKDIDGGFTVDFETSLMTAQDGTDFNTNSGTLSFTGTAGEIKNISISIIDDNFIESTEEFSVRLFNVSSSGITIEDDMAIAAINDDDFTPGVSGISFDTTIKTVNENSGTAAIKVVLSGSMEESFSLDYSTTNGTAISPNDFSITSGSLEFQGYDGEEKLIMIPIIDDTDIEGNEEFSINLSNVSTALIPLNNQTATVTILDNEQDQSPEIGFALNNFSVDESSGILTIDVILNGEVPGGFSYEYATTSGSATFLEDYQFPNGIPGFAGGLLYFDGFDGEIQQMDVAIVDDLISEDIETISLGLFSGSVSGIVKNNDAIVIEIEDDDTEQFTLPSNNFTLQTSGETCASSDNGSILVTAVKNLDYTATLSIEGNIIESKTFRTFTSFQNLIAGGYDICITVANEVTFERCFSVQITEPEPLDVDAKVDTSGKSVTLKMKGGQNYTIDLNGQIHTTSQSEITLPINVSENHISVKTDKDCQGIFEESFLLGNDNVSIFPNPVEKGEVTILVPTQEKTNVLLTLFSNNGIRVKEKMQETENGLVQLNMDGLSPGVYTIIITTDSYNYVRKIIKK